MLPQRGRASAARGLLRHRGLRSRPATAAPGETARPFHVGEHHLGFDTFDLVNQRLVSYHYWIKDGAARTFQSPHRFVWPSELDLMAKLAGMELSERWADWNQTPFTAASTSHVSVWQEPHR